MPGSGRAKEERKKTVQAYLLLIKFSYPKSYTSQNPG